MMLCSGIINLPNMHVMVDPLKELIVVDYGDASIDIMSTERSIHAIRSYVRSAVYRGRLTFKANIFMITSISKGISS